MSQVVVKLGIFLRFFNLDPLRTVLMTRWMSALHYLSIIIQLFATFFNIITAWSDVLKCIQASVFFGVIIQSITKLSMLTFESHSIYGFTKSVITMMNNGKVSVVEDHLNNAKAVTRSLMIIYTLAVIFLMLYPLVMLIIWMKLVPVLPFLFPCTTIDSMSGFAINYIFHGLILISTWHIHGSYDVQFGFYAIMFRLKIDMMIIELDNFTILLNEHSKDMIEKLKIIMIAQQDMHHYIKMFNKDFIAPCLITISACNASMLICLLLFVIIRWTAGLVIIMALMSQLLKSFICGTIIAIQMDRFLIALNSLPWQMMDMRTRKMFVVSIMMAQQLQRNSLNINFIGPLNMESFTKILRVFYAFYTMCLELLI